MITRRTLAKGVAWSVPAVVAVTAAPAYATSVCTATIQCKNPGLGQNNKDYIVHFYNCGGGTTEIRYVKETRRQIQLYGNGEVWYLDGYPDSRSTLTFEITYFNGRVEEVTTSFNPC